MKTETIREAAEKYAIHKFDSHYLDIDDHFIAGAKEQAERMYSEEEVLELLLKFNNDKPGIFDATQWFRQFKKK